MPDGPPSPDYPHEGSFLARSSENPLPISVLSAEPHEAPFLYSHSQNTTGLKPHYRPFAGTFIDALLLCAVGDGIPTKVDVRKPAEQMAPQLGSLRRRQRISCRLCDAGEG